MPNRKTHTHECDNKAKRRFDFCSREKRKRNVDLLLSSVTIIVPSRHVARRQWFHCPPTPRATRPFRRLLFRLQRRRACRCQLTTRMDKSQRCSKTGPRAVCIAAPDAWTATRASATESSAGRHGNAQQRHTKSTNGCTLLFKRSVMTAKASTSYGGGRCARRGC